MAKKKRGSDSGGSQGDKKFLKAKKRLEEAEHLYAEARRRGEQAIQKAQARAERWVEVAATRVGRRLAALERAEQRLRSATPPAAVDDTKPTSVELVEVVAEQPAGIIVLAGREALALEALRRIAKDGGVTAQEWRSASGMAGTTFARSREALVRYGLVSQDGEPSRTTRYTLSEAGASFDLEPATTS
jgi:hypothetical protein